MQIISASLDGKILVSEWAQGEPLSETKQENTDLAESLGREFLDNVFKHHFIYSDIHPGNVLFDAHQNELVILDGPQAVKISPERSKALLRALTKLGMSQVGEAANEIEQSLLTDGLKLDAAQKAVLFSTLENTINGLQNSESDEFGAALLDLVKNLQTNKIVLHSETVAALKAIIGVEGLVKGLNPKVSLPGLMLPYVFVREGPCDAMLRDLPRQSGAATK